MSRSCIYALVAWLLLCSLPAVAQDPWKQVSSTDGRFAVEMPVDPTVTVNPVQTPVGTIETHIYHVSLKQARFEVSYQDIPNMAFWFRSGRSMMATAKKEYLKEVNGTEVSDNAVELAGQKARQVIFTLQDATTGQVVMMLVGHRMYVIHEMRADAADAQKFFASFRILPKSKS